MDDIAQYILQTLVKIKDECEKQQEKQQIKQGIIDNLSGTIYLVKKIRKNGAPTIGFFGAQSRGKSSLINQLLHCDLMPVSPRPMSSVVINLRHDKTHAAGKFTVEIMRMDGSSDTQNNLTLENTQLLLNEYGSHKGDISDSVDTIFVTSNFSESEILENGGILVDTPGAEVAFNPEETENSNAKDAERAIGILSRTQIVIFVERADYMQSKNSKTFFTNHLKPLRPLCVINFKDVFKLDPKHKDTNPIIIEEIKQYEMCKTMLETYEINLERVLCVSCKEAADARKQDNEELLERSNLPKLEKRILSELKDLTPEYGLITCLEELKRILIQLGDHETAEEIFSQAQRSFYVLLQKIDPANVKLSEIAKEIYEEYHG